ncbi:MAG: hypothetical protein JSU95_06070 [Betaproteobacteria bacterium]|nr:MAG: hypothetical protein JSU95_06070 [Betaproteobacteria bacterium]
MKDREVIIGLLRKVAARMRLARVLREAGFALCVVLFALAAFVLIRTSLADAINGFYQSVLVVALVAFCLLVISRALKRVSMAQAASLIDARLPLHDELKSAYWFVSQKEQADDGAAFVRMHVANAARTAQQVRGARVLPVRVPRSLLLAIVPAVVLAAAMWSGPNLVRAGTAPNVIAQTESDLQSARALLAAATSGEEEIKQLDRALETFERSGASRQERQEALIQARDAVDKLNMQASVTREGLARLARAMKGKPGLEEVAEAIEQGRIEDAVGMLQEMREELRGAAGEVSGEQQESAQGTRAESPVGQDIGEIARDLTNMNGSMNEESVTRLLENLEDAQETMRRQQQANAARRTMNEMDELVGMTPQSSEISPSDSSFKGETPLGAPSPDTGKSDLRGATMFRQAAMVPGETDQDDEGSTTGAPSGSAAARALEGRATKRLDAVLKLERVKVSGDEEAKEDDEEDSGWFYSASQQETSKAALADVRARDDYNRADVMQPSRIPIEQQQAVRDYFVNIHEGSN